ncbi:MAG TPA: choice-of-anchor D domain-containing protein, partial [Candidatus Angelobacter sp.]|nr:choice-of-anchor D domain-containing protein [Candidatus Angelobacter sp.]
MLVPLAILVLVLLNGCAGVANKTNTPGFSVSGTISPATGGSGTILTLGGAATATTTADSSGNYTFSGLPNGTYTIVPSHAGFTFSPTSQTATVSGANVTGVNFTATAASAGPKITTQPANQTVAAGQTATFSVVATGAAPLSYQWSKSGTAIVGATSSSYTTPATTSSDNGSSFVVVVSNSAGKVTSSAATLTVNAAGSTVSFSPTSLTFGNQTVGTSSSAQFVTFTNTGSGTLTFGTEPITGDFAFAGQGTCSTSLAAGASCTMSIKFTPAAAGTRTGTLTVNDNASTSPQVVTLKGTGVSSTLPPTGLFGHVAIVVEENTNYSGVTSSSMPYLAGL